MNDKYLENVSKKINQSIENDEFLLAGQFFVDLTKYGIGIEDNILTMICSELSDVYRNCFRRIKEYRDIINDKIVEKIILDTHELLNFLNEKPDDLSKENKIKIFDTLVFIISNAEKIQAETSDVETTKRLKNRIYREFL